MKNKIRSRMSLDAIVLILTARVFVSKTECSIAHSY